MRYSQSLVFILIAFSLSGCQNQVAMLKESGGDFLSMLSPVINDTEQLVSAENYTGAADLYVKNLDKFNSKRGRLIVEKIKIGIATIYSDELRRLDSVSNVNLWSDRDVLELVKKNVHSVSTYAYRLELNSERSELENKFLLKVNSVSSKMSNELNSYIYDEKALSYGNVVAYILSATSEIDAVNKVVDSICNHINSTKSSVNSLYKCIEMKSSPNTVAENKALKSKRKPILEFYKEISKRSNNFNKLTGRNIKLALNLYGYNLDNLNFLSGPPKKKSLPISDGEIVVFVEQGSPSEESSKNNVTSKYLAGTYNELNREYDPAILNYNASIRSKDQCLQTYYADSLRNPYAINLCFLYNSGISKARQKLSNTPKLNRVNDYKSYSFEETKSEITIPATVTIYAKNREGYEVQEYKTKKNKSFKFEKGINKKDAYYNKNSYDTDSNVSAFLESKFSITHYEVLGYIEKLPINTSSGIPLEKAHKPKNKTIVKAIKPRNSKDDLILKNSIVVISTRSGIGTGFYIYPEYILTNYHVTNGTPIVKISSKSGESTSGVVVAFDKELDLALIASPQLKGTQLHLLDSSAKVGEEVKAYGHPKGYTYSVSRGIVSSNRALPIGSGALNRTSKFVQSDVALSPGNSGGPLMQNGSVVGVATWKRIDADVEGLSFSVSSTEIIKWLRDYPQYSK